MSDSRPLLSILVLLLVYLAGMGTCARKPAKETVTVRTDTVTVVRVDTLRIVEPRPVRVTELRHDTIRVYEKGDTIFVPVPIRRYEFADSTFRAVLTGYNVQAESFEIYPRTITHYIDRETTRTITRSPRFGIGIQAGYGWSRQGMSPYVGIGIHYDLMTW